MDVPQSTYAAYEELAAFYYATDHRPLPDTTPTHASVEAARALLDSLFLVHFASPSSRAHALAMLLHSFARPFILDATPLHLISGPTNFESMGLAKSLLTLFNGRPPLPLSVPRLESGWRQTIGQTLLKNPLHIWFNEVSGPLVSETLAEALSAREWLVGRPLWNRHPVSIHCLWVASGSSISPSDAIRHRTISIVLVKPSNSKGEHKKELSSVPKPSLKLPPKFAPSTDTLWELRPQIVGACITFIRAWNEAGQPAFSGVSCFHKRWAEVMGGILEVVEVPGFLEGAIC